MNYRESLNNFLSKFGFRLVHSLNQELLANNPHLRSGMRWASQSVNDDLYNYVKENLNYSHSQIEQDLFASWTYKNAISTGLIQNCEEFFVEFGATNGYKLSNTFYLEKYLNWQGILAEPARIWHSELRKVRKCSIDTRCVYSQSGLHLDFTEANDPELGTISSFKGSDNHSVLRNDADLYMVETVSLTDLLVEHKAPSFMAYLSIDTEGSEYEILRELNFEKFKFAAITVEHNFTPKRELLHTLLISKGYERVLTEVSGQDDWYVCAEIKSLFG